MRTKIAAETGNTLLELEGLQEPPVPGYMMSSSKVLSHPVALSWEANWSQQGHKMKLTAKLSKRNEPSLCHCY
jgi:hypothetical protein